jgi:hypothetical protein
MSLSDRFFSQRWAALNEVSVAVAAAIGKGVFDNQLYTPGVQTCRPLPKQIPN